MSKKDLLYIKTKLGDNYRRINYNVIKMIVEEFPVNYYNLSNTDVHSDDDIIINVVFKISGKKEKDKFLELHSKIRNDTDSSENS